MIAQNTNTVNRKPMAQKLEKGSEINEIEKLIWENVRKGKTKINFPTKNGNFANKLT